MLNASRVDKEDMSSAASSNTDYTTSMQGEGGRDGQGSFKETEDGQRHHAPSGHQGRGSRHAEWKTGASGGLRGRRVGTRRVPGDKDDGHGRRTGLQGVVDEDGREVDVCCGVGTSLWEDWDAVQMGGEVGSKRQVERNSVAEWKYPVADD